MPRFITTLQALGRDTAWMLLQQARGIPDAKSIDDFLEDRTFLVLFVQGDIPERLCITAAIRQMSGHTVYAGAEERWKEAVMQFPVQLLGSISYYMDGVVIRGLPTPWKPDDTSITFPILNCGNDEAHPARALADVACMMRCCGEDLRKVRMAWIGGVSGGMYSLMQASRYFPFSMRIALPPSMDRAGVEAAAKECGTDISVFERPEEAVQGCQFVFAGCREHMDPNELQGPWRLTKDLLARADSGVRVLGGTSPMRSIWVDGEVMQGKTSLLLLQAENRLRVYKRMLHWLCDV